MTRRRLLVVTLAPALLVLARVSVDLGRTVRVVDMYGAPVEGVFLIYHHEGHRFNLAHSTTYEASRRSIVQSRSRGRLEIPAFVHVHWPFPMESHSRVWVDLVYAPALHNGLATIGDRAIMRPGAFEVGGDLASVRLADLSGNPALWEGTLRNLGSILGRLIGERRGERRALTPVLLRHFVQEYEAFLDRYREVARSTPPMPAGLTEQERRAWYEMVERDLAREPRWGDVAVRLFGREAKRFASVAADWK